MEPEATKSKNIVIWLEKVAEVEKIEISDKEAEEKAEEMASNYGISKKNF